MVFFWVGLPLLISATALKSSFPPLPIAIAMDFHHNWFPLQLGWVFFTVCVSLIELHFARIWWVSTKHWLCKEDDLQIIDLWKGFDAQRRFIDGEFGFNKGRMLWLRLASAASYICKNKSTHNQTGMDAIQYHFYHSLEAHFSSTSSCWIKTLLPDFKAMQFTIHSSLQSRDWDSRHHNGGTSGVSGVAGVLRLPAGRRIIRLPHGLLHKKNQTSKAWKLNF